MLQDPHPPPLRQSNFWPLALVIQREDTRKWQLNASPPSRSLRLVILEPLHVLHAAAHKTGRDGPTQADGFDASSH